MKIFSNAEINFEDSGKCEKTLEVELSCISEKLRVIKNPWTGNKRKLIIDLFSIINKHNIEFDSMLDLFSGSGMVSMAAKLLGKKTITNDLMTFAYFNAKAFVENETEELTEDEKKELFAPIDLKELKTKFITEKYCYENTRFSLEEGQFLDIYRQRVVNKFGEPIEGNIKAILSIIYILHHVMNACFVGGRLNNGQVLANLDHRLNHPRNNGQGMNFSHKLVQCPTIFSGYSREHHCYNLDASRLILDYSIETDMAYIDPPYGGQQSDYTKMYSFFEEYIYQKDIDSLDHLKNVSDFSKSKGYYDHFVNLLDILKNIPILVFSYNDSSWCKIEDIEKIIKEFRKNVIIEEVDYSYQYRDQKSTSREFVIIAR